MESSRPGVREGTDRHREAFREAFPQAFVRIEAVGDSRFPLVMRDGEAVNVRFSDDDLYPTDARDWARQQIDEYDAAPDRILFSNLSNFLPTGPLLPALQDIAAYVQEHPDLKGAPAPVVDSAYFFVFGVGLGHHVPLIVERFAVRHVVLVEPEPELARLAMLTQPWADILDACARKGVKMSFLVPGSVIDFLDTFYKMMVVEPDNWFVEGSHALIHYMSAETVLYRLSANERINMFLLSGGAVEDEIKMMCNALGNFGSNAFRLLSRAATSSDDTPVFLIGSGPSVDADIEHLRRLRDNAIYVACGSGLGVLMRNGIKPDLFVETENMEVVTEVFEKWSREFDFSGIQLLGSTTLPPASVRFFEDPILFVRPSLSSSMLVGFGAEELTMGTPVVGNIAFSAMATMGFSNFYFFGIDCGRPKAGRHHSAAAIYYEKDGEDLPVETEYNIEVPGNFGGTFETTPLLNHSRLNFVGVVGLLGCTVVNCSDGAAIDATIARRAADVKLAPLIRPSRDILAERAECWRPMTPELARAEWPASPSRTECRSTAAAFDDILGGFDFETRGLWDLAQAIGTRFERDTGGVLPIIWYSIVILIRLGAFYGNRLTDADQRAAFLRSYAGTIARTVHAMCEAVEAEVCPLVEGGDAPAAADGPLSEGG